jgi:SecD/SecF fusion protein
VRAFLQSTANLQFFEVYTFESRDIQNGIIAADKAVEDYLNGTKTADTTKAAPKDTTTAAATAPKVDTGKTATISNIANTGNKTTSKTDSAAKTANKNPLARLIQFTQPYQDKKGKTLFPAGLGYVPSKDTGTLNDYLRLDIVKNKFPSNLVFMYGKAELDDPKAKDILMLYAIKTSITARPNWVEKVSAHHRIMMRKADQPSKC